MTLVAMAAGVAVACVLVAMVVRQRRRAGQGSADFPLDDTADGVEATGQQLQWNNDDIFWVTRTTSGFDDDVNGSRPVIVMSEFEEVDLNEVGVLPLGGGGGVGGGPTSMVVATRRPSSIDGWSTLEVKSKLDDIVDDVYGESDSDCGLDINNGNDELRYSNSSNNNADDDDVRTATIEFLADVHDGNGASRC
jgi:hypothetical protein